MTPDNLARWGGLAALLAAALLLVSLLLRLYFDYLNPGPIGRTIILIGPLLGLLLGVLIQLALVGMYAVRARDVGLLGLVGFFVAFTGTWLQTGGSIVVPFAKPFELPTGEPEEFFGPLAIFGLTFVLGWVLFGVAALRAGAYPRAALTLLIAGALVLLIPLPFTDVIFDVAIAWMGYVLLRNGLDGEETGARPPLA